MCEWLQSSDPVDVRSEMTGAVASDSATHVYSTSFDPSAACDDGRHHDSLPLISFRVALTRNATTVFAEGGGYGATGTHREHHAGSLRGGACSSRGLI